MPHQCTGCSHVFADGSKEMLSGCPECGGNKFQFLPSDAVDDEAPSHPANQSADVADATVDEGDDAVLDGEDPVTAREDRAQATARSAIVSEHELPVESRPPQESDAADATVAEPEEDPGLTELRKELNQQFESIKILQPGEYELNLMELYDREEYIIALKEDGRYVIEVPGDWRE